MRTRPLGRTGLQVSEIGLGAWQLGNSRDWEAMSDTEAHRLVREAIDLGINLFDTAPHYGATNSERLLGEAIRPSERADVVLVSKFGHLTTGGKEFGVDRFWSELGGSLDRLRTDHLDVLLLHNPPEEILAGRHPVWDALEEARKRGQVGHYGVSLDLAHEAEACLRNTGSTVLEVLFNVLHQDVRRAFPLVASQGTGLLVKVPLDSGWLTGRFTASSRFRGVRARWTAAQIAQRAEAVARLAWLTENGEPLAHQALSYLLAYDEVSAVLPGTRTLEQLRQNAAASGTPLDRDQRARLEDLWDELTEEGRRLLPW